MKEKLQQGVKKNNFYFFILPSYKSKNIVFLAPQILPLFFPRVPDPASHQITLTDC